MKSSNNKNAPAKGVISIREVMKHHFGDHLDRNGN
ncbi:MAG: hypothetical protein ACJA0H_002517, partial [Francisellaceae bacterium]